MKLVHPHSLMQHVASTCTCHIQDSLPCEGDASNTATNYFWREHEDSIMVPFAPVAVEVALKEGVFKP